MKTTFDEEEDLAESMHGTERHDREITLSSTTLLAIFFGLVLLCGLFFGIGYTLGRRVPAESLVETPANGSSSAAALPYDAKPKPSASSQGELPHPVAEETPAPSPRADDSIQPSTSETTEGAALAHPAKAEVKEAVLQTTSSKPTAAVQTGGATPAAATSNGIMVQIAAISNPADADVLMSALRKHGYTVVERHEPTDALLHVQVGPFATRAEANAMRQKLLADGYNAILK